MTQAAKIRGRPPKPAEDAKRHALGIRTTLALKQKIEAAAAESGRSVAQEVEQRLAASFDYDDVLGGSATARLLRRIGAIIEEAELSTGHKWTADFYTYQLARQSAFSALGRLMSLSRSMFPNDPGAQEAYDRYVALGEEVETLASELQKFTSVPQEVHRPANGILSGLAGDQPPPHWSALSGGGGYWLPSFHNLEPEHRDEARTIYNAWQKKQEERWEAGQEALRLFTPQREEIEKAKTQADKLVDQMITNSSPDTYGA